MGLPGDAASSSHRADADISEQLPYKEPLRNVMKNPEIICIGSDGLATFPHKALQKHLWNLAYCIIILERRINCLSISA
jgi:hypothetical protein